MDTYQRPTCVCQMWESPPRLPPVSGTSSSPWSQTSQLKCLHLHVVSVSPVRGVAVAAVHQEVGEHQHVTRPGAHRPRILQRPLSLVHVVSPSAARGVSLNKRLSCSVTEDDWSIQSKYLQVSKSSLRSPQLDSKIRLI